MQELVLAIIQLQRSTVSRLLWEQKIAGAKPASQTNDQHCARHSLDVCKRARFDTLVDLSISAVDVRRRPTSLPELHDLIQDPRVRLEDALERNSGPVLLFAGIAQLVEQLLRKQTIGSSSLSSSAVFKRKLRTDNAYRSMEERAAESRTAASSSLSCAN